MGYPKKCKMIVLDGCDGVGKETQTKLLKERFEKLGKKVLTVSFPNYKSESSVMVRSYLSGKLNAKEPQHKTCMYALDRALTMSEPLIASYLQDPDAIIICDRYASSAMLFDTIDTPDDKFMQHILQSESMEFSMLNIPKPDLNILLHLDYYHVEEVLAVRRKEGTLTDIHEADANLMRKIGANVLRFHALPDFDIIRCGREGERRLDVQEVHTRIWDAIELENLT